MARKDAWNVIRLVLAVALFCGLVALVLVVERLSDEPLTARFPFAFSSNEDCRECHREIWDEWKQDQHSQAWFNNFFPQDPKRTECVSCHASRPILEVGYMKEAEVRGDRFEEGIGCIECHRKDDHVEGPLPAAEAACNPVQNPVFSRTEICNACHTAHGTYDEWRETRWAREGVTCQACHMPFVERPASTGGPVRKVRSHRMRSQRDASMLQEALALDVRTEGRQVVVSLSNVGTAHNCPGEIANRDLILVTEIYDAEGGFVARYKESHRAVLRQQRGTVPSTQLRADEARVYRYDLDAEHGKLKSWVGYKFMFMYLDDWAVVVHEEELAF